jgi:hypothetical protein
MSSSSKIMLRDLIAMAESELDTRQTTEKTSNKNEIFSYLHSASEWHFAKDLPPYFKLYQHQDGRWRADLSEELQQRVNSLSAKTHLDKEAESIAEVVHSLCVMGGLSHEKTLDVTCGRVVNDQLRASLCHRLHSIMHADATSRSALGKKLKSDFAQAIDHLVSPEGIKPRKNTIVVRMSQQAGLAKTCLLEEAAIEMARSYAQSLRELPTKAVLRAKLEAAYPMTLDLSKAKWAKLWKTTGLDRLRQDPPWTAK